MTSLPDRCRSFVRGLYIGSLGAGLGLVVFFVAYLWVFATRGPLAAMDGFKPTCSCAAPFQSFVFVTVAGVLGHRSISFWRIGVVSSLSLLASMIVTPATSIGLQTRKQLLLDDPLFEMEYVWCIFAINVIGIGMCYATAPLAQKCAPIADNS